MISIENRTLCAGVHKNKKLSEEVKKQLQNHNSIPSGLAFSKSEFSNPWSEDILEYLPSESGEEQMC